MPRTPLFSLLRRACRAAALAARPDAPPADELAEIAEAARAERAERAERWTRRRFLATATVGAAGVWLGGARAASGAPAGRARGGTAPRIAIVGAGIAGLSAAHALSKAGFAAEIHEASPRAGGRMMTARDLLAPGLTTELGGEFIDTAHRDMIALAAEFGLPLLDMQAPSESGLVRDAVFVGGSHRTEAEIVAAFVPSAARLARDFDSVGETIDFRDDGGAAALDRTSLADYVAGLPAPQWLRDLLIAAYVTEYGLDAEEQSSLNLLFLITRDVSSGRFDVLGESDERYKVAGGNERIALELARRHDGAIRTGRTLVALRRRGSGFALTFEERGAGVSEVAADVAIVTIPFTLLREVDLDVEIPAVQRRAIAQLGYGANAKILVGVTRRVWREAGYSGNVTSDEAFQLAWDNSRLQPGAAGGVTLYSGGRAARLAGAGTARSVAARLLPGLDRAFPGVGAAATGPVDRFHWPTYRWTRGSYSCYRTGQWTALRGAEGLATDNLHFAGEHTSADWQGFMNGGAESGRLAAEAVLARVRQAVR